MKKLISISLIISSICFFSCEKEEPEVGQKIITIERDPLCDGLKNSSYIPILKGLHWEYQSGNQEAFDIKDSVFESEEWRYIITRSWFETGGGSFPVPVKHEEHYVIYENSAGEIFQHGYPKDENTVEDLLIKNNPVVGDEWFMDINEIRKRKIYSMYEKVITDSCTYFDCLLIKQFVLKNRVYMPEGEFYYKQGVGLVKYHTSGYFTPEWIELTEFQKN